MSSYLANAGYLAILALGFGFVVFWHELGHFLAAKWAGVKVEQFAVGFMQAVFSFRKGLGFRVGSSQKEFKEKLDAWLTDTSARKTDGLAEKIHGNAADGFADGDYALAAIHTGLGETEYRLNWLPLGGYVKMLGQDDLKPNSEADDPRAYNRQSIGKRMVIVSAGVIMNVILGAIGFVIVFSMGFNVAPSKIGAISAGSPAQLAKADTPEENGLRPGDQVISIDGKQTYNDFTKFQLNIALCAAGEEIPVVVQRGNKQVTLRVTPVKAAGMMAIGTGGVANLRGVKADKDSQKLFEDPAREALYSADTLALQPEDEIVSINGKPVTSADFALLDAAVQTGDDVKLTVKRHLNGQIVEIKIQPTLEQPFGNEPFNLLGLVPRMQVERVNDGSPARGRVFPGDVIANVAFADASSSVSSPDFKAFKQKLDDAAAADKAVSVVVIRGGKVVPVGMVTPVKVAPKSYGLSVVPAVDEYEAVVADRLDGSPAVSAGIPLKSKIIAIDGQPATTWREVHKTLRRNLTGREGPATVKVSYKTEGGETKQADVVLSSKDIQSVMQVRYSHNMLMEPTIAPRKANGIAEAASWGAIETRDFILQFYLTLRRMVTRDVDVGNMMGPIGIFQAGTHFASKGPDWLIWFLSMISANLAVVNFLPIPVVDGGLFTFLIAEKIKGKPISPRTQAIAQYVGLALLLGIFLFVTYQDLANFQFRMR